MTEYVKLYTFTLNIFNVNLWSFVRLSLLHDLYKHTIILRRKFPRKTKALVCACVRACVWSLELLGILHSCMSVVSVPVFLWVPYPTLFSKLVTWAPSLIQPFPPCLLSRHSYQPSPVNSTPFVSFLLAPLALLNSNFSSTAKM